MLSFSRLVIPKSISPVFRQAWAGALAALLIAGAATLPMPTAHAQSFPSRPIRVVVPFPTGGPSDILARVLGDVMSKDLGQPFVVINRPGADTILGVDLAAKSPADGYTLLVSGDAGLINTASGRKLPYDLMRDIAPISMIYAGPQVMMIPRDSPFKSLQDLVKHARANPGKVSFASVGVATSVYLNSEIFNQAAGIEALHVPYKGTVQAMTDLTGGRVDYMIGGTSTSIPAIKSGTLRGLALMSKDRSLLLPDVPTAMEQGVKVEFAGWYGLFTTAGAPPEATRKVHESLLKALDSKPVRDSFQGLGGEPRGMPTEQFSAYLQGQMDKLTTLMKRLNIKIE